MVRTDEVIGYYTDVFGNEINDYELIEKYSVSYEGCFFEGDTEGINIHNFDKWEDAKMLYDMYPNVVIKDNEYGLIFENGDWS